MAGLAYKGVAFGLSGPKKWRVVRFQLQNKIGVAGGAVTAL